MNTKKFSEAMGEIDSKYVEKSANYRPKQKKHGWVKWVSMAACLCLAVVGGILFNSHSTQDFNSMIAKNGTDNTVHYTFIEIGERTACYHEVSIDSSELERYVGEQYQQSDNGNWFYPAGVDNLKFLIKQADNENLSLWVFSDFIVSKGDTYTYGDVLKTIYGVDSADGIVSITTTPSRRNNTDLGKSIQKEIGTHTYNDTEDIISFYDIIVDVECFGPDSESLGDQNRFSYSFSTGEQDKLTSGESTYAERILCVTLANGTTIDSWNYDALSGCFYECGGIFTVPLADEAVYILNEMFEIK